MGTKRSARARVITMFDKDREGLVQILEAGGTPTSAPLLALIQAHPEKSLSELHAESGVSVNVLVDAILRGRRVIAEREAQVEFSESLPSVARDLRRNALDVKVWCNKCNGTGEVGRVKRLLKRHGLSDTIPVHCRTCKGTGERWMPTKYKKWATDRILKVTKLIEPSGGTQVNVNQQAALVSAQPGIFARMLEAADEVLYPKRERLNPDQVPSGLLSTLRGQGEVVEAEPTEGQDRFLAVVDDIVKQGEEILKARV